MLAILAAGLAPGASAEQTIERRLSEARTSRDRANRSVRDAEARLAALTAEYERVRSDLDLAVRDMVVAQLAQRGATDDLAAAQDALDRKAAAAYEAGPTATLELIFGSASTADLAAAEVFAASAFSVGQTQVDEVVRLRASLEGVALRLERNRADVAAALRDLDRDTSAVTAEVERARAVAADAGLEVTKLEKEQRELDRARRRLEASLAPLIDATRGRDQSELLARLGPSQGRGCDIPSGLTPTGDTLAGDSSWYGWDFAGNPTASGAIYDPRLFTAANKDLPLNVFLRIHFRDECAIVLVNDRGPYVGDRIIDVSQAVAEYLGYKSAGVAWVTADVLVSK